jgi:hypothetical protein
VAVGLFAIPLSLLPFYISVVEEKPVPQLAFVIGVSIALACVCLMILAVRSRLRQVAGETRPNGQSMYSWVAIQVLGGVGLCLLGGIGMISLQ